MEKEDDQEDDTEDDTSEEENHLEENEILAEMAQRRATDGKNKYIFTSVESLFKSESDKNKFDLARKLKRRVFLENLFCPYHKVSKLMTINLMKTLRHHIPLERKSKKL